MKTMFRTYPSHKLFTFFTGGLCLLLAMLSGCKKNDPENFNKATPTLFQYVDAGKEFGLYRAALKRAGLYNAATFSNDGPFTVFVPVDSAFINAGLNLAAIEKYNAADLSALLKYSIVNGKLSSTSLLGFYSQEVTSLNVNYRPTITKNYYGIFFNGIPVASQGSISLNDGVVHELQRLPLVPKGNLYETIANTPSLSLYAAVLKHTGNDTQLTTLSTDGRPFTVFAPDNEAWRKMGYNSVADIYNEDPAKLNNWLDQYISRDVKFTANFRGGYAFFNELFYVRADGMSIVTRGNIAPTHIIRPDIIANNGVLHIVDQAFVL